MNLKPITLKGVPAHETVCDICDGDSFHIIVIEGHTHFVCANPICKESVCQINRPNCKPTPTKSTIPHCPNCHGEAELNGLNGYVCFFCGHEFEQLCKGCGSGLIANGHCQKCGL